MKQTQVVNIRYNKNYDLRIDRISKWGNPFVLQNENGRHQCILKYEEYIRENQELLDALPELVGQTLGCWCAPLECHGNVLIRLMIERGLINENGYAI